MNKILLRLIILSFIIGLTGCQFSIPKYNKDSWKTMIPDSCQQFSDGCNTCNRTDYGVGCSEMWCSEYEKPKCISNGDEEILRNSNGNNKTVVGGEK